MWRFDNEVGVEAGGGEGVWGEGVKWVVKGVGVRWVEGVDVHVWIVEILLKKVRHEKVWPIRGHIFWCRTF